MSDFVEALILYPFMQRALVCGILISVCAALLGVVLVLKRYSMIGDGLSHLGFGTISIALVLGWSPLAVSLPIITASAFGLLWISEEKRKVNGDAAIAIISCSAIAIGVISTALSSGMNMDVYGYMFGSILTMKNSDVVVSILLALAVLSLFLVFYKQIFLVTFDNSFAKVCGVQTKYINGMIALFTAVTIVIGMRMMGTMLISGLIVFPALSAMQVSKGFKGVLLLSVIISIFCFVAGLTFSYLIAIPTGASIVLCNLLVFVVANVVRLIKG